MAPTKDPEKRKAQKAAYRKHNAAKISEYNRAYRERQGPTNHTSGYSKEEQAAYMREYRLRPGHLLKEAARSKVNDRIKKGRWPKAVFFLCTDCPKNAEHYHHEDYSLWWSVEPLCRTCHGGRHRIT